MRRISQALGQWRFGVIVMAPILLCLFVAATAVVGFVMWSSHELDMGSTRRQTVLVSSIIGKLREQLPNMQASIVNSTEAVARTSGGFDPQWVHQNLGAWLHRVFGQDLVLVLDPRDEPVYALLQGERIAPAAAAEQVADIRSLILELRGRLASDSTSVDADGRHGLAHVTDFALVAGVPALVSIMPILADGSSARGNEYLHVSVAELSERFASQIALSGILEAPQFNRLRSGMPDRAVYPLISASGRFVAFAEWDVFRPGRLILNTTIPALAGAFLITGLVVFLLLDQLWRYSAALETGRRRAQHQAAHDPLTGLSNRTHFDEALGRAMAAPAETGGELALMMLDLDRFKHVNNTLGHPAGDDLIRAVGQRLKELVGHRDTLARLGGDEFAVIHRAGRGDPDAMLLCHRIIDAISRPFEVAGSEVFVGVSIGLVRATEADTDRRELTRKADIALYEAKSTGRNRVVVFEQAMNDLLQNRHKIEAELREALRRTDQLSVAFQPLYAQKNGRVIGAEALVRWKHPVLGQVSPVHFVPVAEGTGLIEALGDFVLRQACQLGGRWPGMTIAVNISPTQMRNPKFPDRVFAHLAQAGMRAADLELEITEGLLLADEPMTTEALRTFRAAGVKIALDDFGTGYSSLNYLKRYAVDRIKIDRSFVSQLAPGAVSTAIVQAMITLAHALGIETTAEGVETREQMQVLAQLGCNTFQGYLFSAPVDAGAIESLFGSERRGTAPNALGAASEDRDEAVA